MNKENGVIVERDINEIKPDPDQPRTIFLEDQIQGLASSLEYDYETGSAHKMINPIEIDENGVIVTGEQRWRAAQLAGWKTVPTKSIDPGNKDDRFLRQVKENVNRGSMSPWDIAHALKRIQDTLFTSERSKYSGSDEYISEVARLVGVSKAFVSEHLAILEETPEIQEALKEKKIKMTQLRDVKKVPEEFRERIKEKFLDGTLPQRDAISLVGQALKAKPEKAEEILGQDYSTMSTAKISNYVEEIAPTLLDKITNNIDKAETIIRKVENLQHILKEYSLGQIPVLQRPKLSLALMALVKQIQDFNQPKEEPKQITP